MRTHPPTLLPLCSLAGVLSLLFLQPQMAAEAELRLLPGAEATGATLAASSAEVTWTAGETGTTIAIAPGKDQHPGIRITPAQPWDLSAFGYVEARIVNLNSTPTAIFLRVDNAGDWRANPWNGEQATIAAGATGTVRVRFGRSWGKPGFALDPAAVTGLVVWTGAAKAPSSFRIEAITPGGNPGTDIVAEQRPRDGALFGAGAPAVAEDRIGSTRARTTLATGANGQELRLVLESADGSGVVKAPEGRWDLRDHLAVSVRLRNDGAAAITPRIRVDNREQPTPWVAADTPLAPGAETELSVSFLTTTPWIVGAKDNLRFDSDVVTGVRVGTQNGLGTVTVLAIRAYVPPPEVLPEWLGKRPPVDGPWQATLTEEFDRNWLDTRIWSTMDRNFWDKRSRFSAENVLLGDGTARLRFEHKPGSHNDDGMGAKADYTTGFLTTNERWTQLYGYFESRVKLPTAPGLWPAFWMMPDRGPEAGIWWKRSNTGAGGMEFDILEYLTRYGPYRLNLALHWDGYAKDHKHDGSGSIYVRPDADGFITTGILWEPGLVVFYKNGREVMRWANERVCSVPMHILFTNVSGGWGGNTLDGSGLPDDFVIDYVRVWQRSERLKP